MFRTFNANCKFPNSRFTAARQIQLGPIARTYFFDLQKHFSCNI